MRESIKAKLNFGIMKSMSAGMKIHMVGKAASIKSHSINDLDLELKRQKSLPEKEKGEIDLQDRKTIIKLLLKQVGEYLAEN